MRRLLGSLLYWLLAAPVRAVLDWGSWSDDRSDNTRYFMPMVTVIGVAIEFLFWSGVLYWATLGFSRLPVTLSSFPFLLLAFYIAFPLLLAAIRLWCETVMNPHPANPE